MERLEGLPEYLDRLTLLDTASQIFRGVPDSRYELIPSVGRYKAKDVGSHLVFEHTIFEEFRNRAVRYLDREPRNDFEWLFLAQNYGIPTRLLDWTTNPLVALYFATQKHPERDCAVYSIDMSHWYVDEPDPFTIKEIGGVHPRHTDIRFINQGGVFTIHPEPTKAMDLGGVGVTEFGVEAKASVKWQLRKMGIHASFIFPGLDSIARDILDEHDGLLQGGVIRHNFDRYMRRLAKEMSEESTQQK